MTSIIPFKVTQEAADYIAEIGLQEPFQRILDQIPKHFPFVHEIAVSLVDPQDLGGGPRVVFDVTRDHPASKDDSAGRQWNSWMIETFPPEVFQHFTLFPIYVPSNAR